MNAVVTILGKKAFGRLKDKDVNTNSDVCLHNQDVFEIGFKLTEAIQRIHIWRESQSTTSRATSSNTRSAKDLFPKDCRAMTRRSSRRSVGRRTSGT